VGEQGEENVTDVRRKTERKSRKQARMPKHSYPTTVTKHLKTKTRN
jgi:hypothetical protein